MKSNVAVARITNTNGYLETIKSYYSMQSGQYALVLQVIPATLYQTY